MQNTGSLADASDLGGLKLAPGTSIFTSATKDDSIRQWKTLTKSRGSQNPWCQATMVSQAKSNAQMFHLLNGYIKLIF
jgi:hypothetical protein